LGRVLGFSFDIETGELISLVMGAMGVPLLGEGVLSTWEIPVNEIVSSGTDRIIVYEGAEEKLKQLTSGLLEKIGIGGTSWDERERDRYRVNLVPVENQLTSGEEITQTQKSLNASSETALNEEDQELEYVELEDQNQYYEKQSRYLEDSPPSEPITFEDSYLEETDQSLKVNSRLATQPDSTLVNRAGNRKSVSTLEDPLDVEPIKIDNSDRSNQNSLPNSDEIEDPW